MVCIYDRVDPATAFHENCQAMLQMGHTQEMHQLLNETGLSLQQHTVHYQPGVVQYSGGEGNRQ